MGFNDIHLRVFFVSLSIFVLSFCGWYYLVSLTDPYTYKGDDGYVKSFISLITPDEGEKKTLVDIKLLFRHKFFLFHFLYLSLNFKKFKIKKSNYISYSFRK